MFHGQWWNVSVVQQCLRYQLAKRRLPQLLMAHLKLQTKLGWLALSSDAQPPFRVIVDKDLAWIHFTYI